MENDVALLHKKIDTLTTQVAFLTKQAEIQQRRQQEFDELKQDMIPIANHMIKLTIDELAEIDPDFEIEDFFFLIKRLLRNVPLMLSMFDRFEALMGVTDEVELLGKQVFSTAVENLDQMEQDGYFAFAREGWGIVEQIVTEFSEEDVKALGENIVTILTTVRNMTQPEIMAMANNAIGAIQEVPPEIETPSMLSLLRELSNAKTRRGMARMINLLQVLDEQPNQPNQIKN
jgi:uncharacterized protein YjgD (DUF1641 family)